MTTAITAKYTSPSLTRDFAHNVTLTDNQVSLTGLTAAITAMQKDINQFLTQRMADANDVANDHEDEEDEEEEEDNKKGNVKQPRRAKTSQATYKKQKTS